MGVGDEKTHPGLLSVFFFVQRQCPIVQYQYKSTLHGIGQTRNVVGEDQPTFYLELSIQITSQSSNNDLTLHIQIDLIKCENLNFSTDSL